MNPGTNGRTIPDIVRDLLTEVTTLLRKEGQLARAELSEKVDQVTRGLGFIAAGAVLVVPALVVLLGALVAAIVNAGIAEPWAALIVGGATLLIGVVLAWAGARAMKVEHLAPTRTIAHVQRDLSLAKHQLRHDHETERAA